MPNAATRFLKYLDSHAVTCCVLGSGRENPDDPDHDVDILVRASEAPVVDRLVRSYGEETSGRLVRIVPTSDGRHFTIAWLRGSGAPRVLRLDVHTTAAYRGRPWRNVDEVLKDRVRRTPAAAYFVAPAGVEFVHTLLKSVERGEISPEAGRRLSQVWSEGPGGIRAELARLWPAELAECASRAAESGDFTALRERLPNFGRVLEGSRVLSCIRQVSAACTRLVERLRRPTACTVAFLGIDGSGKSSLIRSLREQLASSFPRIVYRHFKPNFLERPARPATRSVQFPVDIRPGVSVLGLTRLAYYLVDYSLGYLVNVWPQRLRSALVIFDRHFYDLWIDPIRLRNRIPMMLARAFAWGIPKPDLIFVVDTPPEVAHVRKPIGPPLEEVARQRAAYLGLAREFDHVTIVDGQKEVAALASEVIEVILDRMHERTMGHKFQASRTELPA